jgi:hypothetical protein
VAVSLVADLSGAGPSLPSNTLKTAVQSEAEDRSLNLPSPDCTPTWLRRVAGVSARTPAQAELLQLGLDQCREPMGIRQCVRVGLGDASVLVARRSLSADGQTGQ